MIEVALFAAIVPVNVPPAPVKVVDPAVPIVPEVVIPSVPTSIAPKPLVIDPAEIAPALVTVKLDELM